MQFPVEAGIQRLHLEQIPVGPRLFPHPVLSAAPFSNTESHRRIERRSNAGDDLSEPTGVEIILFPALEHNGFHAGGPNILRRREDFITRQAIPL